jgi:nucleotide-binding universal stress UspA family protein
MNLACILCPVDFSETSKHAIDQAVVMAGYYHSRITALHVLTTSSLALSGAASADEEASELDRLRRLTTEEFAVAVREGIPLEVLVDVGLPAAIVLERATRLPCDLIVIGTHGTSGFQHLVLGSVTEKVLRKATVPVLTVPPRARATSQPFKRILCPVDFSDPSIEASRLAWSLAAQAGAGLTLLHVLEWPWEEPPAPRIDELPPQQGFALAEFRRYSEESAQHRLESLIPDAMPAGHVSTRVANGKSHVQILRVAAEEQTDLIVIGVHGRNPVDMALFGSTTNQVIRRAMCPVLTSRR